MCQHKVRNRDLWLGDKKSCCSCILKQRFVLAVQGGIATEFRGSCLVDSHRIGINIYKLLPWFVSSLCPSSFLCLSLFLLAVSTCPQWELHCNHMKDVISDVTSPFYWNGFTCFRHPLTFWKTRTAYSPNMPTIFQYLCADPAFMCMAALHMGMGVMFVPLILSSDTLAGLLFATGLRKEGGIWQLPHCPWKARDLFVFLA